MNEQNTDNFTPKPSKHEEIITALGDVLATLRDGLINLCRTTEVPEDEYTEAAQGIVETVVNLVGSRLKGALPACEEQHTNLRQKFSEGNAQEADMMEKLLSSFEQAEEDPIYKAIIYGLLILGMMLVIATALQIVQPEMPWWVTPFQAVVVIGSSLFGCVIYKQIQQKGKFCKWLAIIGIAFIVLTSVSCAISKGLFYHQAGSGFSISGTGTARQENVQLFFSISIFINLVLAEVVLSTLLAIQIMVARESQKPLESLKKGNCLDTLLRQVGAGEVSLRTPAGNPE